MKPRAICLGGTTLDILVSANADAPNLPGAKQEAQTIELAAGGGAMNAAAVLGKLGAQVEIHCATGRDEAGGFILRKLRAMGVSTSCMEIVEDAPTGKAVITIPQTGDSSVIAARGANLWLSARHIAESRADLLYVTAAPKAAYEALATCLAEGSRRFGYVAFSPGIGQIIEETRLCGDIIASCDLLMINRQEACELARRLGVARFGSRTGEEGLAGEVCQDLLRRYATGHVCVSDGARGAWLACNGGLFHEPASKPVSPSIAQSSIGAGDTFGATLAYMLNADMSPQTALRLASRNAAATMAQRDAHSGAMALEDLVA
jgi:ribokinase